jgi:hypothetical protein
LLTARPLVFPRKKKQNRKKNILYDRSGVLTSIFSIRGCFLTMLYKAYIYFWGLEIKISSLDM